MPNSLTHSPARRPSTTAVAARGAGGAAGSAGSAAGQWCRPAALGRSPAEPTPPPAGNPIPGLYAAGEVAGFGGGGVHG